jgi:lipid-A-disaccharide synthase
MLVILPFEKEFYHKWHYEVEYVGHPLVEVIGRFKHSPEANELPEIIHPAQRRHATPAEGDQDKIPARPLVALLPGSRKQEILKKLPVMLEASLSFPDYQFVVAEAPGQEDSFYDEILKQYPHAGRVRNQTYQLLQHAKAACVTSGTATLETALFGVPEVICYRGSAVSYQIAKKLIKVKYISLVNLIMDRPVVKELIQDEMTAANIVTELKNLLDDPQTIERIGKDYAELKDLLSHGGNASEKAAEIITGYLKNPQPSTANG